jgi:hyaluronoglucosaminidase
VTGEEAAPAGRAQRRVTGINAMVIGFIALLLVATGAAVIVALVSAAKSAAIGVGSSPDAMVMAPDGRTLYVASGDDNTVTPIDVATGQAGSTMPTGNGPGALAVTPDGRTLYVANENDNTVTPIDVATGKAAHPIRVGAVPDALAITPDGRTLYVANHDGNSVTPVDLATETPDPAIPAGSNPLALAVTPDGRTLYVAVSGDDVVLPIDVATGRAGAPIKTTVPSPVDLALAPDGRTLYVACIGAISGGGFIPFANVVLPVDVATGQPGGPIRVGQSPEALAMAPDGRTLYAASPDNDAVTPIDTVTGRAGLRILKGISDPDALVMAPDGRILYVADGTRAP